MTSTEPMALEEHLETALEHAESDTARYHLRESLQMVYGRTDD
ncbi:hypothetical protein ACFQL1_01765 [Halomicroarcula sp. GCM10025709]|nr:hypothetical protein [Halomicroarcula sp. YJ-61-S]